ncbi:polyribonucleotide nucleotidyltransferase [Rubrivirga sp. S365]|uniref:Polyribonucleotide nucleotidyltransferase n=1 Tax=Rubrivirga litoralis TaxID=3075598 RepID=A0ABU3BUV0_9BACT|nr:MULTISPECIES: polyribonucleotide nucleotidyltransferase [unclassified Rubrivirga]MDT0633072.1 polyribonucleotide nucleotidyltransferase [Rubrivirga sp. F394]MDT7857139.1 polyribonucleotide nucleotidyltransferase [Rubrivirga sp. S365]
MEAPQAFTQTIEVGGKTLTLETGKLAKQADGAVVARLGDTVTLSTAVTATSAKPGQHFFPLTVDYRERFSSKGAFPGGFFKREGRPTDKETLTSRLIDRTIRPLFPDGFRNEVQVLNYVLSADEEIDADVVAGIGSSAALSLSGSPFDGPTAHVRVGRVDGDFVLFPTHEERQGSDIDLIVAGKSDAIAMVEGEMDEISEDDMVSALEFAFEAIKDIVAGIQELVSQRDERDGAPQPLEYETVAADEALVDSVYKQIKGDVDKHLRKDDYDKASFYDGIREIRDALVTDMFGEGDDAKEEVDGHSVSDVKEAFKAAESRVMREMILDDGRRLDGRKTDEIRDIWTEIDYLPRVHGSAVFTRGETQALVMVTLGTGRDVQAVDQVFDQEDKRFYLHYNFPPFSVGETKFLRGPSRREIGHGMLAERALRKVMPPEQDFPYTVRIISDVLESNGSSSMASVCGGSMALMAAGVPTDKPVAGIAMGLIAEGDKVAILSDILGTEDHLGDMDFKLCGTEDGITACQMDIKIDGLAMSTMREALEQARAGRQHILAEMAKTIEHPREDISPTAPRLIQVVIDQEFIGAIIGPGGKIIKGIQADTGASIDIDERDGKGYVTVAAPNMDSAHGAVDIIRGIVTQPEVGEKYTGTVKNLLPFGAILEIMPGKEAMLHVSEIAHGYVDDPADEMQVGDKLDVQLIEIRDGGKLRVSRKPFLPEPTEEEKEEMAKRRSSNGDGGGGGGGRGRGRGRRRD